jgi:hypothetical protein
MSHHDSQVITTTTQGARSLPPSHPHQAFPPGSQIAFLVPAARSNRQYPEDEHMERTSRGLGSTGGSRQGRGSLRSIKSSKRTSYHDMQKGLENSEPIVLKTEYKSINVRGSGVNINGSIGEPQPGKWSDIEADLNGGVMLNGGVNNATKGDVEVVKALTSYRKSGHNSSRERNPDPGCCAMM